MRRHKNNRTRERERGAEQLIAALGFFGTTQVRVSLGCHHPSAVYRKALPRGAGPRTRHARVELCLPHLWAERVHAGGLTVVGPRFVLDAERTGTPEGTDGCWSCDTVLPPPCDKRMNRVRVYAVRYAGEWFLSQNSPALARAEALDWARGNLFPDRGGRANDWELPF